VTATEKLGPDAGLISTTFVCPTPMSLTFATKVSAEALAVGVGLEVALPLGDALFVGVALGDATTFAPFFQTSLPEDLTHAY